MPAVEGRSCEETLSVGGDDNIGGVVVIPDGVAHLSSREDSSPVFIFPS